MTKGSTFPRVLLATLKNRRKMLEQKWMLLESIREKLNQIVEQEIADCRKAQKRI